MKKVQIFLLIMLCSCNQQVQINDLPIIDLLKGVEKKKDIFLSEISSHIEYVKLETSKDCLFGGAYGIKIRDEYIFIQAAQPHRILIFSRQGKFVTSINRNGKGPREYTDIDNWQVSPDGTKILIFSSSRKLLSYTSKGDFLGSINSPNGTDVGSIEFIDNQTILICNRTASIDNDAMQLPILQAYDLNLKLIKNIYTFNNYAFEKFGYVYPEIHKHNQELFFVNPMRDTLFQLNNNLELSPRYIFASNYNGIYNDFGSEEFRNSLKPYLIHQTNQFILFIAKQKTQDDYTALAYNKNSNETFHLPKRSGCFFMYEPPFGPINNLDGVERSHFFTHRDNDSYLSTFQIIDLNELRESECYNDLNLKTTKYKDELFRIVDNSNIDDNPILRIIHLNK